MSLLTDMFDAISSHLGHRDIIEVGFLIISLILFWVAPRFMDRFFVKFEANGTRLAQNKQAALFVMASAVVVIRVCTLPLNPVPFPQFHDEFSYLLAGDTFAHGRLTNPPHQMWIFFDTFHVNQHPTYMSKYPPAQGALLALGELLGHPWIGVLLSCAAMCAAALWALQGWLPPRWALLGAIILSLRVALFSYWMNSYWGGAVAATGGALIIGAFPRILRHWRIRDATLLGLGIAILANSRPFEGLVFCIPIALGLILAIWKKRVELWQKMFPRMVVPLCLVGALCALFMAYYNLRGTGHPFLFPYSIYDRAYLTTGAFVWETPREPFHHSSAQLDNFYNGWARSSWFQGRVNSFHTFGKAILRDVLRLTFFALWPELCFIAPLLLLLLQENKFRFLLLQLATCILGFTLVAWFQPHYAAPLICTLFAVMIQALRHLRHWKCKGRAVGIGLSRVIVLFAVVLSPFHEPFPASAPPLMNYRERFSKLLNATSGEHLVIVRYSTEHNPLAEWVYNDADIDHSKVIWAREFPGVDLAPLLSYFHSRRVWLVEPDLSPPRLTEMPKWLPELQRHESFRDQLGQNNDQCHGSSRHDSPSREITWSQSSAIALPQTVQKPLSTRIRERSHRCLWAPLHCAL